eukprot:3573915-Alexandrium_andersonii.AAC.1
MSIRCQCQGGAVAKGRCLLTVCVLRALCTVVHVHVYVQVHARCACAGACLRKPGHACACEFAC